VGDCVAAFIQEFSQLLLRQAKALPSFADTLAYFLDFVPLFPAYHVFHPVTVALRSLRQ
jgi:hypothetical protein